MGRPKNKNYEVTFIKKISLENCSKKDLLNEIQREKEDKYPLNSNNIEIRIQEVQ